MLTAIYLALISTCYASTVPSPLHILSYVIFINNSLQKRKLWREVGGKVLWPKSYSQYWQPKFWWPHSLSLKRCAPWMIRTHTSPCLICVLPHKHTSVALRCLTTRFTWHRLAGANYKKCSVLLQGIGETITLYPQAIFLSYCSSLSDCGIVGLFCLFGFSYLLKFSLFLIRA